MTMQLKPTQLRRIALACVGSLVLAAILIWLPKEPPRAPQEAEQAPSDLPRHTLIYGGDLFTARKLNLPLLDPSEEEREKVFSSVAPILREADLAMVNLEGMITTGGYYNQLKSCTWMFRAHHNLTSVLKDIGVDLVTLGNNHNGDYGYEGVVEETDHLVKAGIGYAGAGVNREDAARPVYRQVGDVVIAIVGMEMTYTKRYAAKKDRAGLHYLHNALRNKKNDRAIVRHLRRIVDRARDHAHVVVLSPHWDAHLQVPGVTPAMREMGRALIEEAGFDAVLAHGRHHIQGVEIFDGKPVVYDAGNTLIDFGGGRSMEEDRRGMFWQIEFSKAGVHRLEGVAIKTKHSRTMLAKGSDREKALGRVKRLSSEYGTEFKTANNRVYIDLDPGDILLPRKKPHAPKRAPRPGIRRAPTDVLHDKLPEGITPMNIRYENGIRLVGYEMLSPQIVKTKCSSQTVVLYWTTDRPVEDSFIVHLEARRVLDGEVEDKQWRSENHLPGDWMLPTTMWPVGKIIQDKTNMRLVQTETPRGAMAIFTGLRRITKGRHSKFVTPVEHEGVELYKEHLIPLGHWPYASGVDSPHKNYVRWRETRKITLSEKQPWGAPPMVWDQLDR